MNGEPSESDVQGQSGPRVRVGVRVASLLIIVLAAAAFAVIASRPAAPPQHQPTGEVARAQQAVEDLLAPGSGRDPIADLPTDFTAVTGVRPQHLRAPDGTVRSVHVDGGCSTPWGDDNTRWDYSVSCKAHDLGYDLLRYAQTKGQPLPADLRRRLDDRLAYDMHHMCDLNPRDSPGTCRVVASLYSVGLVVNSWHQRWGPPRNEPIGSWALAMLVVVMLLVSGVPLLVRGMRRQQLEHPEPPAAEPAASWFGFLRIISLTGIVAGESLLAFAPWAGVPVDRLWPLTWPLQLVPLFFFAGGHANVSAWRGRGGSLAGYLADRGAWLITPALGFLAAWLLIPLSLELLGAPPEAVAAFGGLVAQPMWLLGLYVLVLCATPAADWLHRRAALPTVAALVAVVLGTGLAGHGSLASHAGGIALALLFQQLAFGYVDGTFARLPRAVFAGSAVVAGCLLVVLTTVGGHSKLLIAQPTEYASFAPSLAGVLLVGAVQVCLVGLVRAPATRAAAERAARVVSLLRAAPATAYLCYLCVMLLLAGSVAAARGTGLIGDGVDWLAQPRTVLALALVVVPTVLAFLLSDRRARGTAWPTSTAPGHWQDAVAAAVGGLYCTIGILGFAVTGTDPPDLLGLTLDPMTNLIHVLLGWYLLHCVRVGTATSARTWLLTALACVPPLVTTVSGAGIAMHGLTAALGLAIAAASRHPARAAPRTSETSLT